MTMWQHAWPTVGGSRSGQGVFWEKANPIANLVILAPVSLLRRQSCTQHRDVRATHAVEFFADGNAELVCDECAGLMVVKGHIFMVIPWATEAERLERGDTVPMDGDGWSAEE